jgi:hypothetical protein
VARDRCSDSGAEPLATGGRTWPSFPPPLVRYRVSGRMSRFVSFVVQASCLHFPARRRDACTTDELTPWPPTSLTWFLYFRPPPFYRLTGVLVRRAVAVLMAIEIAQLRQRQPCGLLALQARPTGRPDQ